MAEHFMRGVMNHVLCVGDPAPDFELPALVSGVRQSLRLSSYHAKQTVALAFYPFNWQEATASQLVQYQVERPRFLAQNAEVITITVESIMNTVAWERVIGPFDFPLCADFWPHGEVAKRYGVLNEAGESSGSSDRAVFVVDRKGKVAFRKSYAPDQSAPVEDILAVLEQIRY